MNEIKKHPWFLKNLPKELSETSQVAYFKPNNGAPTFSLQAVEDIMKIVREARTRGPYSKSIPGYGWPTTDKHKHEEKEEEEEEEEEEEIDEDELEEDDDEDDEYCVTEASKEASAGSSRRKEAPTSATDRVNSEEFLEFTFDLI